MNAARRPVLHGDRKLSPEDAKRRLLQQPGSLVSQARALNWAREQAYFERHGRLPPVFPSIQTVTCQKDSEHKR